MTPNSRHVLDYLASRELESVRQRLEDMKRHRTAGHLTPQRYGAAWAKADARRRELESAITELRTPDQPQEA